MKTNSGKRVMSIFAHIVLILLSFMCLFFFAILLINATHSHAELQKGFSIIPGKHFLDNLKSVANDGSFPMFRGIINSVIVSGSRIPLYELSSTVSNCAVKFFSASAVRIIFFATPIAERIDSSVESMNCAGMPFCAASALTVSPQKQKRSREAFPRKMEWCAKSDPTGIKCQYLHTVDRCGRRGQRCFYL